MTADRRNRHPISTFIIARRLQKGGTDQAIRVSSVKIQTITAKKMDRGASMPQRRIRRHKSSIFEMNTESMMLTDILDALKTEQIEAEPMEDSRQQTIEFLLRMLSHLKELCLTKMSTKDVESLTELHIENVSRLPLNTALTYYFRDIVPEVDRLVQRLKRVSHKKFTMLIRRKISEMFSQIMRQTYEMKLTMVVEKLRQKQQQRRAEQTLFNMVLLLDRKLDMAAAFGRIKSVLTSSLVRRGAMFDAFTRSFANLDRLCFKRNLKQKLGYFGMWRTNSKVMASDSTSQINNLIKTIYLSMVGVVEDEPELHSIVNLSVKKISASEAAVFKLFKAMESVVVHYDCQGQASEVQIVPATSQQLSCMQLVSDRIVYDEEDSARRIMLVPVSTDAGEPVGLFHIPVVQDMSAKTLENLFALSRGLGDIIHRIYLIRNRLTYYDRDCRSLNHFARCMYDKLLDMVGQANWQAHLDTLFSEMQMGHFEILFLDQATHESFYRYCPEGNQYVELTSSAVTMFREEFLKAEAKPFINVNRGDHKFTIFPIWEDSLIKGFINFGYPFELPIAGLVDTIDTFVGVLIARSAPKPTVEIEDGATQHVMHLSPRVDLTEEGLDILKAQSYEDIEQSFTRSVVKLAASNECSYYACLLWPLLSNKHPSCYWAHPQNGGIAVLESKHASLTSIVRSAQAIEYLSVSSNDDLANLLRKFALYRNHKFAQYEKQSSDFRVRAVPVRNRLNEILCVMLLASIDDAQLPRREDQERLLGQLKDFIRTRLRKTAEQQEIGMHIGEEHEKRVIREFHRVASTFPVDYSNFYESLERMLGGMGISQPLRAYRLSKGSLIEYFTEQRIPLRSQSLPKHPYCSHNKLCFSEYHLRFRNRLIVNNKKTVMSFRSEELKQQFMQLVASFPEDEAPVLQETVPEMASLEQLLSLSGVEYLYLPVQHNTFMVFCSQKKWVPAQVDLLHRFMLREYQQYALYRKHMGEQLQQISLVEVMGLKKQHEGRLLRTTITKFQENLRVVTQRNSRLQQFVKSYTSGVLGEVAKTFNGFKESSAQYSIYEFERNQKVSSLEHSLTEIFRRRVLRYLVNTTLQHKRKCQQLIDSLQMAHKQVQKSSAELLECSFGKIRNFACGVYVKRKKLKDEALTSLARLFGCKVKLSLKASLVCMEERWSELVGLFSVVTQEISLVQFSSRSALLGFLDQRLGQPLQRLHKPFNGLVFTTSLVPKSECQYKHSSNYFIFDEESPETITVGWELSYDEMLVVTLSRKLQLAGQLLSNILKLKEAVHQQYCRLLKSLRTRISFLSAACANLYTNNLQAGLRCLHRHTRRIIKEENKKAKAAARDIEEQLCELSQESLTNKENENLQRTITSHRKMVSEVEGQFESLKIDNKIKRKTLSVSHVLIYEQEKLQLQERRQMAMHKLAMAADSQRLQSRRQHESSLVGGLKLKRCGHGFKLLRELERHARSRQVKQTFEWILGQAHRHPNVFR